MEITLIRTSLTHPLYVDEFPVANGQIGLTICPGKKGDSVYGAPWQRDLQVDVDAIKAWGAHLVITLVETVELEELQVSDLSGAMQRAGIAWHHLPMRDLGALDANGWIEWRKLSPRVHSTLEEGGKVLVHCRGGLGRAGTVSALVLIERGMTVKESIATVRKARKGAIETSAQERFLKEKAAYPSAAARAIHASLLAGAIGDSLGAEVEFLDLASIRHRYPDGILELPPHQGVRGAITDDTQMTLFTAEGLIRAWVRGATKGICHPPSIVHHALLRWYITQGAKTRMDIDESGLMLDPRLRKRRAPGLTCLDALGRAKRFGELADNNSKGCGTIMRVAPVAFMHRREDVRAEATATSVLTHGHVTGHLAAAAWAEMLADIWRGEKLEQTALRLATEYGQLEGGSETSVAIFRALEAPRDGAAETVETLGGGWIAEEALAIALYCSLSASNFEEGLRMAVTHSGDSDSTGAIAGNMLGLLYPDDIFNHRWASEIECSDLISRLSRDLTAARSWNESEIERHWQEYPGW